MAVLLLIETFHLEEMGSFKGIKQTVTYLREWKLGRSSKASSKNKHLLEWKEICPGEQKRRAPPTAMSCKQCKAPELLLSRAITHDDMSFLVTQAAFESSLLLVSKLNKNSNSRILFWCNFYFGLFCFPFSGEKMCVLCVARKFYEQPNPCPQQIPY